MKTFLKHILLAAAMFASLEKGQAQTNLVDNASFEQNTGCPDLLTDYLGIDEFAKCTSWSRATKASPDYFNSCNLRSCDTYSRYTDTPNNAAGSETPLQMDASDAGTSYIGLAFATPLISSNYGEYAVSKLLNGGMYANKRYSVEMNVSLAEGSNSGIKNLGAWFTVSNPYAANSNNTGIPLGVNAVNTVVETNGITKKFGWQTIKGRYVAQGGEEYMTLGYFGQNISNDMVADNSNGGCPAWTNGIGSSNLAYYYVDAVKVIECACSDEVNFINKTSDGTKCCFDIQLKNNGNCPSYGVRISYATPAPNLSFILNANAASGWTYAKTGSMHDWRINDSNGLMPGESAIVGNICVAPMPGTRSITIEFLDENGNVTCEPLVKELPLCNCTCDETKMLTNFIKRTNSATGQCCWDITLQTLAGGCPAKSVVVYTNNAIGHQPIASQSFPAVINPGAPTATVFANFCLPEFTGSKTVYVAYFTESQDLLCEIPMVLNCDCSFHCDDTQILSIPTTLDPCCNDIYVLSAPCEIYKVTVDAPNAGTPINQGSPVVFPRLIGSYCNGSSTANNTVTIRLRDQTGAIKCTKSAEVKCDPPLSCCDKINVSLTSSANDTSGTCACKFNIMVTLAPNAPECTIYSAKIYNLGAGSLSSGIFGSGIILSGQTKKIQEVCVPFPNQPINPAWTDVKIYIEFYDQNGNLLCKKYLSTSCYYPYGKIPGQDSSGTVHQGIPEQQNLGQTAFSCLPNPFNNETEFSYSLYKQSSVKLEIYDGQGRLIEVIENAIKPAGQYKINYINKGLTRGVYLAKLSIDNTFSTIRILMEN